MTLFITVEGSGWTELVELQETPWGINGIITGMSQLMIWSAGPSTGVSTELANPALTGNHDVSGSCVCGGLFTAG